MTKNSVVIIMERNERLEDANENAKQEIESLEIELSQLKAENQIKNEAVSALQNDYKSQIDIQDDLKSEISFYQQLLSPSAENKGLRVFDNKLIELGNQNYRLDITLVQKIQKARIINGRFEIQVLGKQENENKSLSIHKNDEAKYEFKYFHRVSLGFSLPKGFKAEQLIVKLFPQNKTSKLIEHSVSWATLIQKVKDNV